LRLPVDDVIVMTARALAGFSSELIFSWALSSPDNQKR